MKFTVLKENLNKALSIVGKSISTRPQLPILGNILIKAGEHSLTLSSTNLETGISYSLGAKIDTQGQTTVPGKLLTDFINSISADKIDFEVKDTTLTVKTPHTRSTFTTANPSDFPPFPALGESKKVFPLGKLKEAVGRIVISASADETRPVLTGVKVEINSGKIALTATDGYRLSKEQIETGDKEEELSVIIPAPSLMEMIRIAMEVKAEEVGIYILENKNQIVFVLPDVMIYTRMIDGEYPNIERIIPAGFKTRVVIEKDSFFQSVKTASLFARGAANIIKVKIAKDGLHLSANTPQLGENEDFVEAKVDGEEMEIAFNYRFLLDLLNIFPDDNVVLETSGALSPGLFKTEKPSSFLHIIMPVRVQE